MARPALQCEVGGDVIWREIRYGFTRETSLNRLKNNKISIFLTFEAHGGSHTRGLLRLKQSLMVLLFYGLVRRRVFWMDEIQKISGWLADIAAVRLASNERQLQCSGLLCSATSLRFD